MNAKRTAWGHSANTAELYDLADPNCDSGTRTHWR